LAAIAVRHVAVKQLITPRTDKRFLRPGFIHHFDSVIFLLDPVGQRACCYRLGKLEAGRIRRRDGYAHIRRHISHLLDYGGFACFVRGGDIGFRSPTQPAIDVRPVAGDVAGSPEPSAAWSLLGFIVWVGIKVRGHRRFPTVQQ